MDNPKKIKKIKVKSGKIKFPLFMPDATRGFVKSLGNQDLLKVGVETMVVNTYHLFLQPGIELIKKSGGIHRFMNWEAPLLSDSGGYQIFSLIHKNPQMGKITEEEVIFKSPLDGSRHKLSPEKSIQIQFDLGVDMMVVLDDPPPNNFSRQEIEKAVIRTIKWAKRCKKEYERQLKIRNIKSKVRPLIFGVIQGGTYKDLRKYCVEELIKIGFDGLGFGARHHDEKGIFMKELLQFTIDCIPENYLKFALGVGTPEDIVQCARMGWEMFDCVIPTREGRHGRLFVWKNNPADLDLYYKDPKLLFYEAININNEKYKEDFMPVDSYCDCELCRHYSRAYLRHLFVLGDPLGMRLAAGHNLRFYVTMIEKKKKKIFWSG